MLSNTLSPHIDITNSGGEALTIQQEESLEFSSLVTVTEFIAANTILDFSNPLGFTIDGEVYNLTTSVIQLNDSNLTVAECEVLSSTQLKFSYELFSGSKIKIIKG